jgi:CheY-like chemotaxis protein
MVTKSTETNQGSGNPGLPASECQATDLELFAEPETDAKLAITLMSGNTGMTTFHFRLNRHVARLADNFINHLRTLGCEAKVELTRIGFLDQGALSLEPADGNSPPSPHLMPAKETHLTGETNVPPCTSDDIQQVLGYIREARQKLPADTPSLRREPLPGTWSARAGLELRAAAKTTSSHGCNTWVRFASEPGEGHMGKARPFLGCSEEATESNGRMSTSKYLKHSPEAWANSGGGATSQDYTKRDPQEHEGEASAARMDAGRRRPRFLVIEDEVYLAEIFVELLEALNFEAEAAFSGEAALGLLSRRTYDVVLTDIDLPDTNGFDVIAIAHGAGWLSSTRVVFCSGNLSEDYPQRVARFPGISFLRKPFTTRELMNCIVGVRSAPVVNSAQGTLLDRADLLGTGMPTS